MEHETQKDTSIKATESIQKLYGGYVRLSDRDKVLSAYLTEKTSRIAAVVLLVATPHNGHDELSIKLEKSALGLVCNAATAHEPGVDRNMVLAEIGRLVALLDVGVRSRRISEQNATIISDELIELHRFLGELAWGQGRVFIPSEHLKMRAPEELFTAESRGVSQSGYQGQEKATLTTPPMGKETVVHGALRHAERDVKETPVKHYTERVQDAQKDRRATILGMLQRKDRVSVRDVALVIKDCSEKTLQRELLALVAQGVLIKEGERRWSTYRLA